MEEKIKQQWIAALAHAITEDAFLKSALTSALLFGSFLRDDWDARRSDLDLFFYVTHKKDKREVFQRMLAIIEGLNARFHIYPSSPEPALLKKLNEEAEFLFVIPLFFSGFHVIVLAKADYDIVRNRAGNPVFRFFKHHIFSPALFLDNVRREYKVLYGDDILTHAHLRERPDLARSLVFPFALLIYVIPFLLITPRYALGWTIKSSRLAEGLLKHYNELVNKKFLLSEFEARHSRETQEMRKRFYQHAYPWHTLMSFYFNTWRFVLSVKRHV